MGRTKYVNTLQPRPFADTRSQHVVAFPIAQGRLLNIASVVTNPALSGTIYEGPWRSRVSREELIEMHKGWEPAVEGILKVCVPVRLAMTTVAYVPTQDVDESGWSKWAIHAVNQLPTFVDGRVALLGDAVRRGHYVMQFCPN